MKRYRICYACARTGNTSSKVKGEKKYICPHCEHKKSRPGTAIPKAAAKGSIHGDCITVGKEIQV